MMHTRIERAEAGVAVHIPRAVADDAGLLAESEVDVALVEGKVVLTPMSGERMTLEGLRASVTEDNRHGATSTRLTVGQESW